MADVVPLRPAGGARAPCRQVWRCVCGNALFWLYSDGAIECAECGGAVGGMDGYWRLPASPHASPGGSPGDASPEDF
jgi:hypothetical protein